MPYKPGDQIWTDPATGDKRYFDSATGQWEWIGTQGDVPTARAETGNLVAQYLNALGIPAFGASPYQKWQAQQAGPTLAALKLRTRTEPGLGVEQYLSRAGILGARQGLGSQYEAVMGAQDTGAAELTKRALGDLWEDFLESAATAKLGRFFGPQIARTYPMMQAQYEAGPGFGEPAERGFLNYIRQQWGI